MRRILFVLAVLVLLPVLLVGTVGGHVMLASRTAPETFEDFRDYLDEVVRSLMDDHDVPGVAVALVHDGRVASLHAYGEADKDAGIPVTEDTVFQAASISKSFTAWGVMRLVEEGTVDLDAPISTYLSRWDFPRSRFDSDLVTARRLLSHTGGVSVGGYLGYEPGEAVPPIQTDLAVGDDAAEADGSVRIVSLPGEQVQYSGGGYAVLQLLVEEVSGQSFADFMSDEVLTPLGMTTSSFDSTAGTQDNLATPYGVDGSELPLYRFAAKSAGGLYTTAPDLARFVAASTAAGSGAPMGRGVLEPSTVETMQTSAPDASITMGPLSIGYYGLGYSMEPVVLGGGGPVVGHDGSNQGWKSGFLALPDDGEGIVVLTNAETGKGLVEEVKCRWVASMTRGTSPPCLNRHLMEDALIGGGPSMFARELVVG
jgi:CubicO group peptidase (beta-lactamase class C family)